MTEFSEAELIHQRKMEQQRLQQEEYSNRQKSEWSHVDNSRNSIMMHNEFDLKTYLLDVPYRNIDFDNILSIVTKELDTSFINQQDFKIFYQILFENILEWANMGLKEMAKLRLAALLSELKIEKSVGGFERILQGSTLTGSVTAPLPRQPQLFSLESIVRKKEERRDLPPILPSHDR